LPGGAAARPVQNVRYFPRRRCHPHSNSFVSAIGRFSKAALPVPQIQAPTLYPCIHEAVICFHAPGRRTSILLIFSLMSLWTFFVMPHR
jgi:hypothetical protein